MPLNINTLQHIDENCTFFTYELTYFISKSYNVSTRTISVLTFFYKRKKEVFLWIVTDMLVVI